ncbi:hypothetical protein pEaSNUABM47_00332 [Erwinia phage pEa_SNUABM_47]|uniref:Uncharacterized protein n=1 Tax=Erwinia phage pEa_SNUABM_47 TaxID=2768774 RepID=A0A7L8ZMV5_9CAUD|nr:hypothetical protein pEaSNUABM47_00332 [Erwinia phage pEa_SNUABM_47]QXO12582.1 hypothetical protein pEaSNUABM49_00336 [Erwinia phage pEa_SNUABM_49]
MKTVNFLYTEGVSYKATNVENIESDGYTVDYSRTVQNESGTVVGVDFRSVSTEDLLFATVKDHSTGIVTIIPGIYDHFDIVPKGNAVTRQQNIEREAAAVAANRAAKAPERNAKELAKFEARRAARKAAWEAENGVTPVAPAPTPRAKAVAPEAPVMMMKAEPTPAPSANTAIEQLRNAGVSESDIAVLKSLNVLK